ncbi:unnamed protein product [Cylindrotheca closterium]|uniref:Protochlorophyllide reductase n=1 Tax=Cylindrotheca closterium TaxID=2856 RepID=A0AAD2G5J3_9STRA|nr:unnamed protein product [Cylindrotheca closterium]
MKTVMVTGSNVGLGKECARQLASEVEGVEKIILACRNPAKAEAAKEDLERITSKQIFQVLVMDVCDLDSVRNAVASLEDSSIDGLVLNAGGMLGLDLTADGVTISFAGNVLGHVVLTQELFQAGKLKSGSTVVYSSSEAVRDIPELSAKRVQLDEHSVEEFKRVADGRFIASRKSMAPARGETYGVVKYMGTLWTSYMARQHHNIRFVSISPGASSGTKFFDDMPMAGKLVVKGVFKVFAMFGRAHGVEEGAKRYIDALMDDETFPTGGFYASKKGSSGPVADQAQAIPSFAEYKDTTIQDKAAQAIHEIINQKDFVNTTKTNTEESTAA